MEERRVPVDSMDSISYVLMVVVDPVTASAVGLIKKKGPTFLLNKLTFPGGRIEEGESPRSAATRELFEEAGIHVPESAWTLAEFRTSADHEMYVLAATSCHACEARQMEDEPVVLLEPQRHLLRAVVRTEEYAPDFVVVWRAAMKVLNLPMPGQG
jgi:8-oxo-dGTP pyrophosphatase MutT (NUDIX family)